LHSSVFNQLSDQSEQTGLFGRRALKRQEAKLSISVRGGTEKFQQRPKSGAKGENCEKRRDLEDVQGALCEDGAKGGGQPELYQTLQMGHFLRFRFSVIFSE